jgi:transcriptional regulator with AAA-type ATPase domain
MARIHSGKPPNETTAPAYPSQRHPGGPLALSIRWVFPDTVFSALGNRPHTLGRDIDCDTVLPGSETSRRHASVVPDGSGAVVRDLDSRNGVFVNGERVSERRAVVLGDVIRLGEWVGLLRMEPVGPGFLSPLSAGWYAGPTLTDAIEPARRTATTDLPIVIEGETGAGKEGVAQAIHAWSQRKGPFVGVNCAALPETLAEAELFGYARGAFTGAHKASEGFFRAADGGTLLLDEVLDLPLALQAKLLRVLEQGEVQPLGEARPARVDVRVLAATQEPLERAVADGRFRADLLARLDGLTVKIPPLRERREDIVPLFEHFLAEHGGGHAPAIDAKLVEQLLLYDWPLNVRELVLLARRLMAVHGKEPKLSSSQLPERMQRPSDQPAARKPSARAPTDDKEAFDRLVYALREHAGNVARAAAAIGISRPRAYRLLEAQPDFDIAELRPTK